MLLEAPFQIYSAAAGSGKTYTLAKTYLSILLQSSVKRPFQQILAITFTNKAAAEMKDRVLSSLHYFAHRCDQSEPVKEALLDELSRGLSLSKEQLRSRSKIVLKEILHNYSAFELTTIDAFTHKLIRSFALDLALNPGFEVTLEPHTQLKEAIERLIDSIQEDEVLKALLRTLTYEQIERSKSFDISHQLFEFSKELLNESSRKKFQINQLALHQIAPHKALLKKHKEAIDHQLVDKASTLLKSIEAAGKNAVFKSNIIDHLDTLVSGQFDAPKLISSTVTGQIEQGTLLKKGKEVSSSILESIAVDYPTLVQLLHERNRVDEIIRQLGNYGLMQKIFNLYQSVLKEEQLLPIAEFNALISDAIADQPTPYIYERIGSKYQYFFIDEFQDTSVFQWHNLKPLLSSVVDSAENLKEGLVFIVGDAKQSIYRWRGGDAQQFIDLQTQRNHSFSKLPITENLSTNYRSDPVIVHFNNHLFELAADRLEDPTHQHLYKHTSLQQPRPGATLSQGLVRVRFIEKTRSEDESFQLSALLDDLAFCKAHHYSLSDMAVLVSTNAEAQKVAEFLMNAGLDVISSEALDLKRNATIKAVIALMRYALDRNNPLHAFEVVDTAEKYSKERFKQVRDALNSPENSRIASFEHYLRQQGIEIDHLLKSSAYVFAKSVIDHLSLGRPDSTIASAGEIDPAFCNYLLELIHERQHQKKEGIQEFISYFDSQESLFMPLPENDEALRITTIHKSKGLEFNLVFIPFAIERNRLTNARKEWLRVDDLLPIEEMLLPLSDKTTKAQENSRKIYEQERTKTALDHLNQLYVACTRAKNALFIYTEVLSATKEGIHYPALFYDCLKQHYGFDPASQTEITLGQLQTKSTTSLLKDERKIDFAIADPTLRFTHSYPELHTKDAQILGTLFHQFMRYVYDRDDILKAKESLSVQIKIDGLSIDLLDQCVHWANLVLSHPELKHLFGRSLWSKNEAALLDVHGALCIPDRFVLVDNAYTLIEYKTGAPNDSHVSQINQYAELIEQMLVDGKPIRVKDRIIIYLSTLDPEITITHL